MIAPVSKAAVTLESDLKTHIQNLASQHTQKHSQNHNETAKAPTTKGAGGMDEALRL